MKGFAKKYPKEKAAPMASPSAKLWKASPSTTFKLDLTSGLPLPCYFTYHMFHSYHTGRRGYGGFLGNFLHLNFVLMFNQSETYFHLPFLKLKHLGSARCTWEVDLQHWRGSKSSFLQSRLLPRSQEGK